MVGQVASLSSVLFLPCHKPELTSRGPFHPYILLLSRLSHFCALALPVRPSQSGLPQLLLRGPSHAACC